MWKRLLDLLKIQESERPWIEPIVSTLIYGGMIVAAILSLLTFLMALFGQPFLSLLISSIVALGVMFLLNRLSRLERLDLVLNLLLAAITIYASCGRAAGLYDRRSESAHLRVAYSDCGAAAFTGGRLDLGRDRHSRLPDPLADLCSGAPWPT